MIKPDEAFLVEGQHNCKYGWHHGTYRALTSYGPGILVYRDRDDDNALTDTDLGLDQSENNSINIH